MVLSTSIAMVEVVGSDDFVGVSVEVETEVMSIGISEDSVVEVDSVVSFFVDVDSVVSFFVDGESVVDSEVVVDPSEDPSVLEPPVDITVEPSVEITSPANVDCVTPSKVVLEPLVISLGNVEVDSDSDFSVVDSETFVVDGVVGRVISGGQGLSFVVLLIVGRVGIIDESGEELSELNETSVEVKVEVSEVDSTVLDGVDDATSSTVVELSFINS